MVACDCREPHARRRMVLTGGPGAGKTAVLALLRQSFCRHMAMVPEAAGVVFSGGFPRASDVATRRAGQRAIYFVQRELEAVALATDAAVILCDRGTVDGAAYWPGPDDVFASVGTTAAAELARYDAVIHLRTPPMQAGYNHENPLRIETAGEAMRVDERILAAWSAHPRRFVIEPAADFLDKATRALRIVRDELPSCCRSHVAPTLSPALT